MPPDRQSIGLFVGPSSSGRRRRLAFLLAVVNAWAGTSVVIDRFGGDRLGAGHLHEPIYDVQQNRAKDVSQFPLQVLNCGSNPMEIIPILYRFGPQKYKVHNVGKII